MVRLSTPSSLANGNAVIAVKDAGGTILWSWHIWVCKGFEPKKTAQEYNNNAGTMMDRNLGATSAEKGDFCAIGLLYQWGRKDPFLNSGGSISYIQVKSTLTWPSPVESTDSTGTIAYAVQNPTTFITKNYHNQDWYYSDSSTDDTRWQAIDKEKGMYDPCPRGWRVPSGGDKGVWAKAFDTSTAWTTSSNWDSINKGMDFGRTDKALGSGTIWYPAAGMKEFTRGSLDGVGKSSYYWSCTPYGVMAYGLFFYNGSQIIPLYKSYRAYGQSVRCLSE